ncbi:MAG: hypothetical protein WEC75_03795 [Dehalococcoidia bacterium]
METRSGEPLGWARNVEHVRETLLRFPFALSAFVSVLLVLVLLFGRDALAQLILRTDRCPRDLYYLAVFVASAAPPGCWWIVRRPGLTWPFMLGQDDPDNSPAPLTGVVLLLITASLALWFAPENPSSRTDQTVLQLKQEVAYLRERIEFLESGRVRDQEQLEREVAPVQTLAARVATVESLSSPQGDVGGEQNAPKASFSVVDAHCGEDDSKPTRVDVDLRERLRAGRFYWMLRRSPDYPQSFPHGPPQERDEDPELTFLIFTPVCERRYDLTVLECHESGHMAIQSVVDSGRDASVETIPADCVPIATGSIEPVK